MADLEKLDNAIKELEKQSNDLRDFNSVFTEIAKLKHDIMENLKFLKENNERLNGISKEIEGEIKEFNKRIAEIYNDNKAFQKELDASITSRIDRLKSDIQVVIRDEGNQIQRAIETTLNSGFNQMESKMKHAFEQQTKQLNKVKTLTFILIAVSVGLAVGLFFLGS
jgi:DNA repair exonuclease SbcCD ATPase subunit